MFHSKLKKSEQRAAPFRTLAEELSSACRSYVSDIAMRNKVLNAVRRKNIEDIRTMAAETVGDVLLRRRIRIYLPNLKHITFWSWLFGASEGRLEGYIKCALKQTSMNNERLRWENERKSYEERLRQKEHDHSSEMDTIKEEVKKQLAEQRAEFEKKDKVHQQRVDQLIQENKQLSDLLQQKQKPPAIELLEKMRDDMIGLYDENKKLRERNERLEQQVAECLKRLDRMDAVPEAKQEAKLPANGF